MFDNFLNYDETIEAENIVYDGILIEDSEDGAVAGILTTKFGAPHSRKGKITLYIGEKYINEVLKKV